MKKRCKRIRERYILAKLLLFVLLVVIIPFKPQRFENIDISPDATSNISPIAEIYHGKRSSGPDLEINSLNISIGPEPIMVGETEFITAEIHNIGNEGASFINVTFTVNSTPLGSPMILPHLMSNSSENVTKMWQPSYHGNHTVRIILDEDDLIQELNESNNEASVVVFVSTAVNVPPTVNITYPMDHERVSGTVIISGTAFDSAIDTNNLTEVEVKIDSGGWQSANGRQAWEYQWDTTSFSEGLHTVGARAYDGEDHSPVKSVAVIVDNDMTNRAPVANITSPQTGSNYSINQTIFLRGNESYDPDDGPEDLNFSWDMGDGEILYGMNVNHSYSEKAALVTVTLRVYDGDREDSDSIQLFIDNTPPVAVAGEDRTAELGEVIIFNGSRSYDPDLWDRIENYTWNMGNGEVLYGDEHGVVEYAYTVGGGQYEVTLTVADMRNTTDRDSLTVTLNNTLPIAILGLPSKEVCTNVDLFFDAIDSHDPDGEVVEYYFDFGDGESSGWISYPGANHTYLIPGEYAPRLKVKDALGGISLWNSVDITVLAEPNQRPLITITSPLADAIVASPLIVEGTSNDPDAMDTIRTVEVTISGNKMLAKPKLGSSLAEWVATFNISGLENGEATLGARSYDGKEYSDPYTVNVDINNDEPVSITVIILNMSDEVFVGDPIEVRGKAGYDTGVAVAEANVTLSFIDEISSGMTDRNGLFSFTFSCPAGEGSNTIEIGVERDRLEGFVEEAIMIYKTDFLLMEDSIKVFRGQEEIVGYNDAPRKGETVELRVEVFFHSDAKDGPAFTGIVNISQVAKGSTSPLLDNESIIFTPDGKPQSKILSVDWMPDEGINTIAVNIAAGRDSSPENNSLSRSFTVRKKEYSADFAVTEIRLQEEDIVEGISVTVVIEIVNLGNISGYVNVSLYEDEKEEKNLVGRKERIFLKSNKTQVISINWNPSKGYAALLAVLDSSLDEENKDNNHLSVNVKVYPGEEEKKGKSNRVVTGAIIGMILVLAAAIWVFYRKKEAEEDDMEGEEERDYDIDEESDYEQVEALDDL